MMLYCRSILFPIAQNGYLSYGYNQWTDAQLNHVWFNFIELISNVKNRNMSDDMTPMRMKNYIYGIQRGFPHQRGFHLNLFFGPILNSSNIGLFSILENGACKLQKAENQTKHHNVLSKEALVMLFNSQSLFSNTPKGFQN